MKVVAVSTIAFALSTGISSAQSYVPLLDEYEGVKANTGNYLILPAFENTDPQNKRHAYFIFPKFLGFAIDENDGTINLGINHIGFSLLPDGSADYAPRLTITANISAIQDNKTIAAIKDELIKRDTAAGLQEPAFPVPNFEKYEMNVVAGALAPNEEQKAETFDGGYPGQPFLISKTLWTDANRAFVLDTPASAGRDAKIWGVAVRGKIKGYGNRLNCHITLNHSKVYNYFKARASGQAYWGIVKADVSKEIRDMSESQVIDFGACRGDQDKIDKLVMPTWQLILDMQNDDGEKMFYQMVKDVSTPANHPEASGSGWGFQASAAWATVSTSKHVEFNFNVSTPIYWTLPMSVNFASSCSKYKSYFINASDPKKPCVDAKDASKIRAAQKQCVLQFIKDIANSPFDADQKKKLSDQLLRDGCGFNFTSPRVAIPFATAEKLRAQALASRATALRVADEEIRALDRQ